MEQGDFPTALQQVIGFTRVLDLSGEPSLARVQFEGRPEFTHSQGTAVQGGIITAWLDHTMARAVTARDPQASISSLEIKVSFLARVGPGPAIAEARVLRMGRNIVFVEATLLDMKGKLLATASSSGMVVRTGVAQAPLPG